MFPHKMRHKNNPMRRNAAWGSERVKHALEKRNCPAGTACRETSDVSGGYAFQARRMCGFSPSARFASRMGLRLFRPAGAVKKLKGRFLREGFSEKRTGRLSVKIREIRAIHGFKKICGSPRDPREKFAFADFAGQAGRLPSCEIRGSQKSAEVRGIRGRKLSAEGFRQATGKRSVEPCRFPSNAVFLCVLCV